MIRKALLLAVSALAVSTPAQSIKFEKYKLPNGMTVILHEDHSVPVACVNIWYRVGSKDEPPQRSGFAHLFEHLMFMGSNRVPRGQFDTLMEGGGGSNNATTAEDRTNYFSSGPSNLLPLLLWLDADRLQDLGKAMTQEKLNLQRDVVKNERRQNTESVPYGKAYEAIAHLAYPEGHPYSTGVIGSMEDLDRATVQDVKDFFATFYVPNNASLVVAGDFNPKEIKPLIASYFGTLPRQNDPARKFVSPAKFDGVRRVTMVDKVEQAKVIMAWHSPARFAAGDMEMRLTSAVLADGLSSRLYDRLITKTGLASEVSAYVDSKLLGSLFTIDVTAVKGADLHKVEAEIDATLRAFLKIGPTAEELKRQSARLETGMVAESQSAERVADELNEYEFYLGRPDGQTHVLNLARNATPTSVKAAAAKVIDFNRRLVLRVVPESVAPAKDPRDAKPTAGAAKAYKAPSPVQFKLSNGIGVQFWPKPEIPMMALTMQFERGADQDPAGKAGLAVLSTDLATAGTKTLSSTEFEKKLDLLGASFGVGADQQNTSASLTALSRNFEPALLLAADALRHPRLDPQDFDRVKRLQLAQIAQSNDDPGTVARLVSSRLYFGAKHPLSRPLSGTQKTVQSLTKKDVQEELSKLVNPQDATIFVAGNLSLAQVKATLEKAFGSWKPTGKRTAKITYPQPAQNRVRLAIVDRPGSVQTSIRLLMPSVPYASPDRLALRAFSTVLGGTFTSRLNHNLREDKGYTYGIGSRYSFLPQLGYFQISADVQTPVTGASLKEILKELNQIAAGDVTAEEAGKAVNTIRTDTIHGLESLNGILGTAMSLNAVGRPFTVISEEFTGLQRVNVSVLNGLTKKALPMDKALFVLVGDAAKIKEQLAGLGLPEPEIVSTKE